MRLKLSTSVGLAVALVALPSTTATANETSGTTKDQQVTEVLLTQARADRGGGDVTLGENMNPGPSVDGSETRYYLAKDRRGQFEVAVTLAGKLAVVRTIDTDGDSTMHVSTYAYEDGVGAYERTEPSVALRPTSRVRVYPGRTATTPTGAASVGDIKAATISYCIWTTWPPHVSGGTTNYGDASLSSCTSPANLYLWNSLQIWSGYNWYVYAEADQSQYASFFFKTVTFACSTAYGYYYWRGKDQASVAWEWGTDYGSLYTDERHLLCA